MMKIWHLDQAILKECFEQGIMGIEIPAEYHYKKIFQNIQFLMLMYIWRQWSYIHLKCYCY